MSGSRSWGGSSGLLMPDRWASGSPLGVGDMAIVKRPGRAGDEVEVYDTLVDGRPRHPELLEAEFPQIEAMYRGITSD
ncbi:MAG: hypothetical protein U0232_05580 [Thermomicrobiales bacterium]